jgi:hypothetical protein
VRSCSKCGAREKCNTKQIGTVEPGQAMKTQAQLLRKELEALQKMTEGASLATGVLNRYAEYVPNDWEDDCAV